MLYTILYQLISISTICGILGIIIISFDLYHHGWKDKHTTSFLIGAILLTIFVIDSLSFSPVILSDDTVSLVCKIALVFIFLCFFEVFICMLGIWRTNDYYVDLLNSKSIFFIILPIILIICSITYSFLFYNDYVVGKDVLNENVIIDEVETKELCMFDYILLSNEDNVKNVKTLYQDVSENDPTETYLSFWYINDENNIVSCKIPNENITIIPTKNDKSYVEIANLVKLCKKKNKVKVKTKEITQAPTKYTFYIQDGIINQKE